MKQIRVIAEAHGESFSLYNADCVDFVRQLPPCAIDLGLYSPPFSSTYLYSDSPRDMGNCVDDVQFLRHYGYLAHELFRVLRPGRVLAVHCKDLVNYKGRDGMAGLRDFPGDLIRSHQEAGFSFHSRVTIWKCPVTEMQKTKAHGLLYKQLRRDSTFSRQGLAEYVLIFRKWAGSTEESEVRPVAQEREGFPLDRWQEWASPVWKHIDHTNVLNVEQARDDRDEKHMCPLALDVIERCVSLWSNPGDTVFSPFAGIGSEGYGAIKLGRKFIGCELKQTYFEHGTKYLQRAEREAGQRSLFDSPPAKPATPDDEEAA